MSLPAPLILRLDDALMQLRRDVERQSRRQRRRQERLPAPSAYQIRMTRQLAILEGLGRAWMTEGQVIRSDRIAG